MTTTTNGRRAGASLLVALTMVATLLGTPADAATATVKAPAEGSAPTEAMTRAQYQVLDLINRARRSRGRRAIRPNGLMNKRAMNWAIHLRSRQALSHRRPPYGVVGAWCAAAENVGRSGNGGTVLATHKAFMRSSGHRSNILNSRWTDVGVGVARDRAGEWFIVHAFADYRC